MQKGDPCVHHRVVMIAFNVSGSAIYHRLIHVIGVIDDGILADSVSLTWLSDSMCLTGYV